MFSEKIKGRIISCSTLSCKWYILNQHEDVFICEYCADNYFSSRELEHDLKLVSLNDNHKCDMSRSAYYGYERRYFTYNGFQFNARYSFPNESESQPAPLRIPKPGSMIVQLPNDAYWELILKVNPNWDLGNGYYFMKCRMNGMDITDDYLPIRSNNLYKINSYNKFTRQSCLEDDIFEIIIYLYHRKSVNDKYEFTRTISITLKLTLGFNRRDKLTSKARSIIAKQLSPIVLKLLSDFNQEVITFDDISNISAEFSAINNIIISLNEN